MKKPLLLTMLLFAALLGCKKEKDPYKENKYTPPVVINPGDTLDPNSFVGLHHNIFKPTCANSGCHDGTFEPDYRTLESTYNTLVLQPIIKNNPDLTYQYRVKPGDAENSILYRRLIEDIDGQSGTMPIAVDPESDWNNKKGQYIQNIKNWINNGAKDMFGNAPSIGNLEPIFKGVMGNADNNTDPLPRGSGKSSIIVPVSAQKLTLWFSFSDDDTQPGSLSYNKIRFSGDPFQFQGAENALQVIATPVSGLGYFDDTVSYTHKIQIDLAAYAVNNPYYFRVYVKDSAAQPTEIPKNGSANYIRLYFSFIRQ